ncbi:MAG TPA: hypothetical protein VI612_02050 [Candidatus Nanoarchaeia archaeon]|nr:hypothetical protein [Candidatus Nanoarchaeia archaeon]
MEDVYIFFAIISVIGVTALFLADASLSGNFGMPSSVMPHVSGYQYTAPTGGRPSTQMPRTMGSQGPIGMHPEICTNGIDDDADRLIDCNDVECRTDASCSGGCRVDQYTLKKPGALMCRSGNRVKCVGNTWQALPCQTNQACYGNGNCR